MKISIITDIHNGMKSKNCPHVRDLSFPLIEAVEQFVDQAAHNGADVLLDLGDRIDDVDHVTDLALAKELAPAFKRFPREVVHIMGNHDVVNLSKEDNEAVYGCSFDSRVIDLGEFRLIAWQPNVVFDYVNGRFPPTSGHLGWLVQALLEDDRPAVIASHVSLSGRAQTGNYYHHFHPTYSTHPDHEAVRAAVEKTGRAAIWLAGHSHWNTWSNISNIHHFTIQSFTERYTTYPKTAATHADLIIENGQFALEVHGNDPLYMRLPFQRSGAQFWLPPVVRR
ncbi:MAG TPA: metallophosphoesterase [Azospirillum sp.]|nr:metallophosphoesterase [Azospirillum sp.]